MMKYKGYPGQATYDDAARIFHGEVIGIDAVITFQGKSVEELEQAFKDSIDDYLEWCKERGKPAEKPFASVLNLKISSRLHAKLFDEASKQGQQLNAYIIEKLKN